jgi:hypothetical protein
LRYLSRANYRNTPAPPLTPAGFGASMKSMRQSGTYRDDEVPTLGALQRGDQGKWVWLACNACHNCVAAPLAPFVISGGLNASSNLLRRRMRCSRCGTRSTSLTTPSWIDTQVGWEPFPTERGFAHPRAIARRALREIGVVH